MAQASRRLARLLIGSAAVAAVLAGGAASSSTAASLQGPVVAVRSGPVMIELQGKPSAVAYTKARLLGASKAVAGRAGKSALAANEQAQQDVLAAIDAKGIDATTLFQVQSAYNGIAVQADAGAIAELEALPGVKGVHEIPLLKLDNHSSVPLIGGPQAWSTYAKTGSGIRIGVIDTGVDYVHRGLGGSGSSADYMVATSAAANPPAATDNPGSFSIPGIYPNARVVGGFDFVGDAYTATGSGATPHPDPNPMDCNGHGSHVTGTAAGNGVNADGTAFSGPYATLTNPASMIIGPGVAPQASIYGLRVFGCAGSTAVTVAAINWATDPNRDGDTSDHLDVINMSLGSAFGTADDASAAASDNAAAAGVIVVTSAGNSGDTYYDSGSPGSATRAIATASSLDAAERADAIVVTSPAAIQGEYIASRNSLYGWGISPSPPNPPSVPETTGNVYYPATNQFGCSPWTGADATNISGKIVLVDWKIGTNAFPCGSAVRGGNAFNAGAIGIIMADSTTFLDTAIAGDARIPGMYTNVNVGNTLKSQLVPGVVNPALVVKLSSLVIGESNDTARIDALSSFSSRGPRTRDNALKPDISAPGQTIWSVNARSGNGGRSVNGTSQASPHVAGVLALLKQAHPLWSVEELKALAMNTAGHDVFGQFGQTGDKYGVGRVGAGRVDVAAALASSSISLNDDGSGAVSVSFGAVEVQGKYKAKRKIRIENVGTTEQTYNASYDPRTAIPGVEISVVEKTVKVKPGQTKTIQVELSASSEAMQNTRDATVAGVQTVVAPTATSSGLILPRQWLSESSGLVVVTPSSGPTLRVPIYAAARPASKTKALEETVALNGGNTATIEIHGKDVNTGAEPAGYQSKVSAFELGITSGLATLGTGVSELARGADLQYVGATRKGNWLYFGLATQANWSTPASDVQFNVQFDRDNNGSVDAQAFTTRFTFGANADPLDIFVTAVGTSVVSYTNVFDSSRTTAPYNSNVLVVPVPVAALGLPAGTTAFRYRVVGQSRFWGTIDTTDWAKYDTANAGIAFSDGLTSPANPLTGAPAATTMFPDLDGQTIGVTYNAANAATLGSQGVLLLHHFAETGKRAEVLPVLP